MSMEVTIGKESIVVRYNIDQIDIIVSIEPGKLSGLFIVKMKKKRGYIT